MNESENISHSVMSQLFVTPWTVACLAPVFMEFSMEEYWSGLPFPSPGDLPDSGIEPRSPALQADSLMFEPPVQFSHSVVSDSLRPHGLQPARLPCPSPTPGACSNSCPWSRWCHSTISFFVIPFYACLQSFSASGSFQ